MQRTAPARETPRHYGGPVIRVFGGIGLFDEDGPISIGGPRQRRLLALLAIREGSSVELDWLAEYLWRDDERPSPVAPPLRTAVSRLRSSFPGHVREWIVTESDAYGLTAPREAVEHLHFAQLRAEAAAARELEDPQAALAKLDEALSLWRGEPFRELEDLDWAAADIERLRIDHLEAMEERWEAALALGRHTQITGELAAFTMQHADRDRAVRQQALALHRSGHTADALKVITRHKKILVEEYGLDPSADVLELEEALIAGDPSLLVEQQGRPLRGYRLLEEVSAGAFAIVWRGVQPSVEREVAIKQIRAELASQPDFIRRFEAEAHLVADIEHPHVVPLVDFWRDPDSAYLVMRWLRGGTLERRLEDGPLSVDETARLAHEIGGALRAAHAKGVVHRDVKSANILFDESGNAYLTDFGIALVVAESSGPEAALSSGSPAYSAPEQRRGERLGPPADVFSLGVVLYECLTGATPGAHGVATPLPQLRADVPAAVADAIARALVEDPADRYPEIGAFLSALDGEHPSAVQTSTSTAALENPYHGLRAFDDVDADRFFGRERLVAELVARLAGSGQASRCVVVVGPSGSGKSSVVRAGLVPALRAGAVKGSDEWFVTTMVPGVDPFEALEAALLRVAVNPPHSLLVQLRDGPRGLLRAVRRCLPADGAQVVLVVDQFETVFTQAVPETAIAFLDALSAAIEDPGSPVRLVVTLRADYFDRPLQHPAFAAILDEAAANVQPLSGDELERAIVEPARAIGVTFEPGLAVRIAADAAGRPASLPLLQYTLAELFDRRSGASLTLTEYEKLGGITGALAARAEALYLGLDAVGRSAARRVFGRLVSPSGETADVRRRAQVAEFGADRAARLVLDGYAGARLLTFDRDPASREPTVEVAHEALLREWPRLQTWLAEDRDLLRVLGSLSDASDRWEADGREPADLLRGARLATAMELVGNHPDRVRPLDVAFVQASTTAAEAEAAAERRGRRRQGLLAAGIGIAAVIAVAAGVFAIAEQDRADDQASAAELAAERADVAELLTSAREADDSRLGILLALEAQRRAPGPDTDHVLLTAIRRSSGGHTTASYPPLIEEACTDSPGWVAADGTSHMAVVDGHLVRRDLVTGATSQHGDTPFEERCGSWFQDRDGSVRLAIAGPSDERTLYLGTAEGGWAVEQALGASVELADPGSLTATRFLTTAPGLVRLVDAGTGRPVGTAIGRVGASPLTAMAPDGSRFAVLREPEDGGLPSVTVHDAADGREMMRLEMPADPLAMALDPSEEQLLVASSDRRLRTFELERGEVIGDVDYSGSDPSSVSVAEDGRVTIVSPGTPGTPGTIETLDRNDAGAASTRIQVDDLVGGHSRPDGMVVVWDSAARIDVIDPEVQPLAAESIELDAYGIDLSGTRIRLVGGKVEISQPGTRKTTTVDLASRKAEELSIDVDDGARFPTRVWPFVVGEGYAAVSMLNGVGWWRDGDLVDRLTPGSVPGTRFHRYTVTGPYLALAGLLPANDYEIHLLAFGDEGIEHRFTVHASARRAEFAPMHDGGLLVVDDEAVARRWDPSGQLLDELHIAFEPEEELLAFDGIRRIAIAHDGVAPGFSRLELVDLDTRETKQIQTIGRVEAMGFAQDGALLVTQTSDGAVQIMDLEAGTTSPVVWKGDGAGFVQPWYDPATDSVWVGDTRRVARIPLAPVAWREIACERAGRDLTVDEWGKWVPGGRPQTALCDAGDPPPSAGQAMDTP